MNQHLQAILKFIQQDEAISAEEKNNLMRGAEEVERELANKNRELEIEGALESVRSSALAMKEPADMLEVCRIIAGQLAVLNVKEIRNVQTAIFYEAKGVYVNYEFYVKHDKTLITEVDYSTHAVQSAFAEQMMKGPNEFFTQGFTGNEVQDWYAYQKTTNVFLDSYLEQASSLNYYWYSLGSVALGMSTYLPLTEEQIILFQRFRNVFGLAYRRYLDIEQALAQAKEARIETSLERVRAVAMAMRKPGELAQISVRIFTELTSLDFTDLRNTEIIINNDSKETIISYYSDYGVSGTIEIDYKTNLIVQGWADELRKTNDAFVEIIISENEMDAWRKYREEIGYLPDAKLNKAKTVYYYSYSIGLGALSISSFIPVTKEQIKILERFRNVFKLSYQRYIDIEQAETQAREAQIELALERVRARTMAMHNSSELIATAEVISEQLKHLGAETLGVAFAICEPDEIMVQKWTNIGIFSIPYIAEEGEQKMYEAWKNQKELHEEIYEGERIQRYYELFLKFPAFKEGFDKLAANGYLLPSWQKNYAAIFKYGYLLIITTKQFEEANIFVRFAKVFEQTYTRFLDLQQAEAQAREAQIQLALERIRAGAMAMRQSDELSKLIFVLYQELTKLDAKLDRCFIMIVNPENTGITWWLAGKEGLLAENGFFIQRNQHRSHLMYLDHWKRRTKKWQYLFEGKEKKDCDKFLFTKTELAKLPMFIQKDMAGVKSIHLSGSSDQFGSLVTGSIEPLPEEHLEIISRFADAFNQAYTRFLDLQKAEAQAREAQIEAALERIRSKSLAMFRTADIGEVVGVLFEQMQGLSVDMSFASVSIFIFHQGSKELTQWIQLPEGVASLHIPYLDHPISSDLFEAKESGADYFARTYSKEEKDNWLLQGFELTDYKKLPEEFKTSLLNAPGYAMSIALAKHSGICIPSFVGQYPSAEDVEITKRVSKVFEQAYIRFLDLQKAETQAREAQIQLALERVRARTMAMHKSEDLAEVANLLFQQVQALGVPAWSCGFNIWEEKENCFTGWMSSEGILQLPFKIPLSGNSSFNRFYESRQKGELFYAEEMGGEKLIAQYQYMRGLPGFGEILEDFLKSGFTLPTFQINHVANFLQGNLIFITSENVPEAHDVFKRFAKVFEQTYTRFLDLKRAEAQARESQIQLALERIRAKTMAMQHSSELREIAAAVHDQILGLGFTSGFCSIVIMDRISGDMTWWMFFPGKEYPESYHMPFFEHPFYLAQLNNWKEGEKYAVIEVSGEEKMLYDKHVFTQTEFAKIPIENQQFMMSFEKIIFSNAYMKHGAFSWGVEPIDDEHSMILQRFAGVFEQCYTRFLDLQKAETQAREAQIQLALERVRSKTMAMHSSEDVTSATETMFDALKKLGLDNLRCGIANIHANNRTFDVFGVTNLKGGYTMSGFGLFGMDEHPVWQRWFESWKNKEEFFITFLSGQEKETYFNNINSHRDYLPQEIVDFPDNYFQAYYFEEGAVWTYSLLQHTDGEKEIMKRFATGFSLTFRRYQDLKKAEGQAKEARIEAAMEKVRARAMAMQKPNELVEVAQLLRKEMGLLGVEELETSSIYIHDETTGKTECWYAIMKEHEEETKLVSDHMTIDLPDTWVGKQMLDFYRSGPKQISIPMKGAQRKEWINYCANRSSLLSGFYGEDIPDRTYHLHKFSGGYMGAASPGEISADSWDLLKRATNVFSLAYTRFSDLQQAEAQAREANIEASLERVRAKAMAMHNSDDLSVTTSMVFTELRKLGINPIRCGVGLFNKENLRAQLYAATTSPEGDSLSLIGWAVLSGHPVLEDIYNAWLTQKDIFPQLSGEDLKLYYQRLLEGLSVTAPSWESEAKHFGNFFSISVGSLYAWSEAPYNESEIKILKRFATIVDLTFRRYLELQKSEASAKEAVKQASLDRIRADIASMRTITDLDKITPLIWNELTVLGINFIRCGVFIMDELQQLIHTFLSTPDGKAIAAFHLPFNTPGNFSEILSHWRIKKIYASFWTENDFEAIAEILVKQAAISTKDQYLGSLPAGGFYLYFLPFLQGMLYVGNANELGEEEIKLMQSVADAFSTAYARYEDFNKLEAAKQQVENTLTNLRKAQLQLVQSEKMASLGELTAGIAHEIQNPLNFVNNFSEVSTELVDEMNEEINKGNLEDAKEIANDLKQNLEKINLHGKRAGDIVKGMLQHSRTSSGQKEPTNINALADEYLRLAYHGLRAKDKSFNASIKTNFDESIGNINIIPQDMGRVILNLITNAFYAVAQRGKVEGAGYEPTVSITTKRSSSLSFEEGRGDVTIFVTDNGNGIPKKIVDKIFQPFFTTKPTGQGTGLGLSLSYDIVKAHNGEIKVESIENEGTTFTIQLPMS